MLVSFSIALWAPLIYTLSLHDALPILGASFTAVTVMVKVCGPLVSMPPFAVPPLSWRRTVTVATPLASAAVDYGNVAALDAAGGEEKSAALSELTRNETVCEDSLAGTA